MNEELIKAANAAISALTGSTLSTAESLTGGLLGAALTSVPGASAVYVGGVIAYSNELKIELLGVSQVSLATETAVSEQVAREMAEGVLLRTRSDYALSTTGYAGPEGQVGKAFVGIAWRSGLTIESQVRELNFPGDTNCPSTRDEVRQFCVAQALDLLLTIR